MMTPSTVKPCESNSSPASLMETKKKMKKKVVPVINTPKRPVDKKNDKMKCRVCHVYHPFINEYAYQRVEFDNTELAWFDSIKCIVCECDFHLGCIGMQPFEKVLVATYVCKACESNDVKTIEKTAEELGETANMSKIGSRHWLNTVLLPKEFEDAVVHGNQENYGLIVLEDGLQFTEQFDVKKEWRAIYVIKTKNGLGLQLPQEPFDLNDLIKMMQVDPTQWLENVIDVTAQIFTKMSLDRFAELFMSAEPTKRIYNILSLEFSRTGLLDIVIPPEIYRTQSLADRFWPLGGESVERCDKKHEDVRPAVERFVQMGMGGSYTDFHIDFGGTSVWIHVYQGQKIFYIAPPTPRNLQMFEEHKNRMDQDTQFLGDSLEQCWRVVVDKGETLLLPGGYIHAVYTPLKSIVFAGNILTFQGLPMQIKIHEMDTRRKLGDQYGYPSFDTVMFYTALSLCQQFKEYCEQKSSGFDVVPDYLTGAKALVEYLNENKEVQSNMKKPPKFARGLSKKQIAAQLEEAVANAERMEAGVPAAHPEENSTLAAPASEEETPSLSNETLQNDPPSEVLRNQGAKRKISSNGQSEGEGPAKRRDPNMLKFARRKSEVDAEMIHKMMRTISEGNKKLEESTSNNVKEKERLERIAEDVENDWTKSEKERKREAERQKKIEADDLDIQTRRRNLEAYSQLLIEREAQVRKLEEAEEEKERLKQSEKAIEERRRKAQNSKYIAKTTKNKNDTKEVEVRMKEDELEADMQNALERMRRIEERERNLKKRCGTQGSSDEQEDDWE